MMDMIQLRELGEYLAEPLGRGWAEGRSAGSIGRDGAVPWGVMEVPEVAERWATVEDA